MFVPAIFMSLVMLAAASSSIDFEIFEGLPTGSVVGKLKETEQVRRLLIDNKASSARFDLFAATFSQGLFSVNRLSGVLTTTTPLDRERICTTSALSRNCVLSLHVQVFITSKNTVMRSMVLRVRVRIKDVNDNAPRFDSPLFDIQVAENSAIGSLFDLPLATDADTKKNGVTTYLINDTDGVFILNTSGRTQDGATIPRLEQRHSLDRETRATYRYTLWASDGDEQKGALQIRVKLVDVNDNAPVWAKTPDTIEMQECKALGEPLLTLRATDADEGQYGQIRYHISSSASPTVAHMFYVNGNELYASDNPDYEKDKKLELPLVAEDGGRLQTTKTIMVVVKDCNDHRPEILIRSGRMGDGANPRIRENEKAARLVATILVNDNDDKANGETECEIDATEYFQLALQTEMSMKPQVYDLLTLPSADYDREQHPRLPVIVTCTDHGSAPNQLSSSRQLLVEVEDENDNPPAFRKALIKLQISENNHVGDLVGSVLATDPDSGQNGVVTYSLAPTEASKSFRIDTQGNLRALRRFDREATDNYRLKVIAQDNGKPQRRNATATVIVTVLDRNDNEPRFPGDYRFEVTESKGSQRLASVFLGRLNATDPDNGSNGTLTYSLVNFHPDVCRHCFIVTHDGTLRVSGLIDRERTAKYRFRALATDQGYPEARTGSTWVMVTIRDLNDNKPRFRFPTPTNDSVSIAADTPVGQQIAQLLADDPDEGENRKIIFRLPTPHRTFKLHEDGRLILKRSLEGEGGRLKRQRDHKLVIRAENPDDPSMVSVVILNIFVRRSYRRPWGGDLNTPRRRNGQIYDTGRPGEQGGRGGSDGMGGGAGDGDRRRGTSRSNSLLLLILTAASVIVFILVVTIFALVYLRKIPCQGSSASKRRRRPPGEKDKGCSAGTRQEELFPIQSRGGGLEIEKITDDSIAAAKLGEKTLRKGPPPSYSSTEKGSAPSLLDRQVSGGGNYSYIPAPAFDTLERHCGSGESADVDMGTGKLSRKCYRPTGAESHAYTELEVRDVLLPEFGPVKDCPTYQNTLKSNANWPLTSNTAQRTPVITSSFV